MDNQAKIGDIVRGKVTGITSFGAFVALDGNISGLVHISEVSTDYVKEVKDYLSIGQEVEAIIISVDNGKIGLSIKRLVEKRKKDGAPPDDYNAPNSAAPIKSFEEMMNKFKSISDERMTDIKRGVESKRGTGKKGGKH